MCSLGVTIPNPRPQGGMFRQTLVLSLPSEPPRIRSFDGFKYHAPPGPFPRVECPFSTWLSTWVVPDQHLLEECQKTSEQVFYDCVEDFLRGKQANANCADLDLNCPLHFAIDSGIVRLVQRLLQAGANPNMPLRGTKMMPLEIA